MRDEYLHGPRRAARAAQHRATAVGAGAWGTLLDDPEPDTVLLEIDGAPYGPVPFVAAVADVSLAAGDRAFVHFDTRGETAYAVVWPTP